MTTYFKIKIDPDTIKNINDLVGVELEGDYLVGYEDNLKKNIEGQGISILEDMEPHPLLPSITEDDFAVLYESLEEHYQMENIDTDKFHRIHVLLQEMEKKFLP